MSRYTLGQEVGSTGLFTVLDNGVATNAKASKLAVLGDRAEIRGGEFHGGEFHGGWFYGGEFRGGEFHGGVFRGGEFRGGWLPLQTQGSRHFLNIPDGKTIQIGCKNGTPAWWRKNYKAVGQENGYTEAQIEEYLDYIRLATKTIKKAQEQKA